jgi:ribosomal protein S18 acetylase RimI-like enzyme
MVSFRPVAVDDPAAHALIAEYFDSRAETFPQALGLYQPTFPSPEQFVPPVGLFLILVDDTLPQDRMDVGCGGIRALGPTRFEIKHLWVQPRVQGRGFGRMLLTELEQRALAFGATEVVLDTNASLVAAGGLYRSSGYSEIDPYNDNPNATHWFGKELPVRGQSRPATT